MVALLNYATISGLFGFLYHDGATGYANAG